MKTDLIELYSGYLLSSYGQTTATGLSKLLDGSFSHDQVTRLLPRNEFTNQTLWEMVKPVVRQLEKAEGVLIFDDTIQEKPYSKENSLISWHYDHTKNRSVKGINLLNCPYHTGEASIPVAYKIIEKTIEIRIRKPIKRNAEANSQKMNILENYYAYIAKIIFLFTMFWPIAGFVPRTI